MLDDYNTEIKEARKGIQNQNLFLDYDVSLNIAS